jgi:20S proteasome subunit alpha 4
MSGAFENSLGVFSPDGRLIQVEYAQHASNQGVTVVLECLENSIQIAYEKRSSNPLLIPANKIHKVDLDRHFSMIFSGFKADSLLVVEEAIGLIYNYKHTTSEDISLEKLAKKIAAFQQAFTVDNSMRPLGLRSVLFGLETVHSNGNDSTAVPKMFVIETDGNFAEYSKYSLGFKNDVCNEFLENNSNAFKAISEVVQMDFKKVSGFELTREGLKEFTGEEIQKLMNE